MGYFSKHLFEISMTDKIDKSPEWDAFLRSVKQHMPNITKIFVNCYRGCAAITELIIHHSDEKILLLTIFCNDLSFSPVSDDDIRVNHKQISLPDVVDVLVFIVKLSQEFKLTPYLRGEQDSSEVLIFKVESDDTVRKEK